VLYVYAITDSPPVSERAGLQGARLRAVGRHGLFAMVTDHAELSRETAEEDLWAHEGVVEELMQASTVIPMRFGSTIAHQRDLEEILEGRRREFAGLIERVRGAVELGVRARIRLSETPVADGVSSGTGPGAAYMRELVERERREADAVARIHEPLEGLARRSRRMTGHLGQDFKGAYLVDRSRVDAFSEQVDRLAAELDDALITCTGPWPPYSFSSEENR
jgi:hypothetical protein